MPQRGYTPPLTVLSLTARLHPLHPWQMKTPASSPAYYSRAPPSSLEPIQEVHRPALND